MPNLPLARRPRQDMQFGNCEMDFTIKWLTNLVAQDVWSYELLLVEYYPQLSCVLMCSQPSQWVFYFSGANCGFKPCTWNLRRLPPWGVVGNLWRCRISVELKCRKVWICQGKCLGHVDREHAIALLKSYGRIEICVFSLFFVDVRTFCLICTHLSSVLNSMLNKSSLTFRTAADAQGDFPQGALSNVFVEGRALQWFLSRLRRLPSPTFIQHHRSSYMLRLAPCVQVMDELLNHLVKTDVLYIDVLQSGTRSQEAPTDQHGNVGQGTCEISHWNSFTESLLPYFGDHLSLDTCTCHHFFTSSNPPNLRGDSHCWLRAEWSFWIMFYECMNPWEPHMWTKW